MKTMYVVKFIKSFTKGPLKGLNVDVQVSFPTLDSATQYMNHCIRHITTPVKSIGGADYTCHLARIETIEVEK